MGINDVKGDVQTALNMMDSFNRCGTYFRESHFDFEYSVIGRGTGVWATPQQSFD